MTQTDALESTSQILDADAVGTAFARLERWGWERLARKRPLRRTQRNEACHSTQTDRPRATHPHSGCQAITDQPTTSTRHQDITQCGRARAYSIGVLDPESPRRRRDRAEARWIVDAVLARATHDR
jgi:hypothetical protein